MIPTFPHLVRNQENLPAKFHTHLLGHKKCVAPEGTKEAIDQIFDQNAKTNIKQGYVFLSNDGDWYIKTVRKGSCLTTPDTHLYRVRKALKVNAYIERNGLQDSLVVPEKYLYWNDKTKEFVTVAPSLDLSDEVAAPVNKEVESKMKIAGLTEGGQAVVLYLDNPQRKITAKQAKALADLSFLGCTDWSYNNLFFDKQGRIAVIDTEPQKRAMTKYSYQGIMSFLFGNRSAWKLNNALAGTAKLKQVCGGEALKEIEKVERKQVLWHTAKMVAKIAIVCMAIYAVPAAVALLALTGIAATVIKAAATTLLACKAICLVNGTLGTLIVWKFSSVDGIPFIAQMEMAGAA